MNIKTTIVLFVLLLGVGGFLWYSSSKPEVAPKPTEHSLLDLKSDDVSRFVITGADGKKIAAQKTSENGMPVWKLTDPVTAPAESYKISSLLESLTGMQSTAQVPAAGSDAPKTGIDTPQYTVDLYSGDKDTKFAIGDETGIAGGVYIKINGADHVDVVNRSILDTLEKPANDLRKTQLFETSSSAVQQLTILRKDGSELVLEKQPKGWQMIKPIAQPADTSAVEDILSAVINMTPVEFVDDPSQAFGLNKPVATVIFSATAPSTQPTTSPTEMAGAVKVIFGSYDDLAKKNIFAQTSGGTTVKVAATVLDSLNKKPLELRNKTVLDFEPAQVQHLSINMDQPATTQPTVQPATTKLVVLARRKKDLAMGPVLPTTNPTTAPAVKSDWVVGDKTTVDADDTKVTSLLNDLHPLKADKYLEAAPTAKPVKVFTLMITPGPGIPPAVLELRDPGNDGSVIGSYNNLWFEMPRTILTDLGAEFAKAPAK
jgi:hypothetical protein